MNTLQDLRSTLDAHAAEVTESLTAVRVAAVAGRARVVRRRRAVGMTAIAALAVGAVGAITLLPGGRDISPADAPDSMTSLGWRYELSESLRADSEQVAATLGDSDLPRLISWSTDGDEQAVVVKRRDATAWASDATDFGDFVWVPPGYRGDVTVSGPRGLTIAVYELDASGAPAGVGEGAGVFREDVAGRDLAGAAVGEPGQASLEVPVDLDRGMVWVAYTCDNLPRGYDVRTGFKGEHGYMSSGKGCAEESDFDPGASPSFGVPGPRSEDAVLRIWVTRRGGEVADGELPDLRLGLGAYQLADEPLEVAGFEFARLLEHEGKVFEAVEWTDGVGRLRVPEEGDYLVDSWVEVRPESSYSITIDGTRRDDGILTGIGESGSGPRLVRPGAREVGLRFGGFEQHVKRAALVLYRRGG